MRKRMEQLLQTIKEQNRKLVSIKKGEFGRVAITMGDFSGQLGDYVKQVGNDAIVYLKGCPGNGIYIEVPVMFLKRIV